MKKLYGIVCANITPMNAKGQVDYESLKRLVDYMADGGNPRYLSLWHQW